MNKPLNVKIMQNQYQLERWLEIYRKTKQKIVRIILVNGCHTALVALVTF